MRALWPVPAAHHGKKSTFIYKSLCSSTHVYLRNHAKKNTLSQAYSSLHKVLNRINDRVFLIDINGRTANVSVENLKSADILGEDLSANPLNNQNIITTSPTTQSPTPLSTALPLDVAALTSASGETTVSTKQADPQDSQSLPLTEQLPQDSPQLTLARREESDHSGLQLIRQAQSLIQPKRSRFIPSILKRTRTQVCSYARFKSRKRIRFF